MYIFKFKFKFRFKLYIKCIFKSRVMQTFLSSTVYTVYRSTLKQACIHSINFFSSHLNLEILEIREEKQTRSPKYLLGKMLPCIHKQNELATDFVNYEIE